MVSIHRDNSSYITDGYLTMGVKLPAGTFLFSDIKSKLHWDSTSVLPSDYVVAASSGDDIEFFHLKEQDIGAEIFTTAIRALKNMSGPTAQQVYSAFKKAHGITK